MKLAKVRLGLQWNPADQDLCDSEALRRNRFDIMKSAIAPALTCQFAVMLMWRDAIAKLTEGIAVWGVESAIATLKNTPPIN
ncbi:hypothetical protein [Nodularia sp. NIES-3585]|uniref:hypothetical protein n=1 Tax=Nodularia sp. NIES-3585 TaxID=1973477 RepID=UPI000B5C8B91|nr:hypothetical protein [Nodularia sp. NIES-3585]GAX38231.1 hypothetical protein NIES3585_42790 [Nodularia sp. NIES-3585]